MQSGISYRDGECVGVTDGSYVFDSAFTQIQQKIEAENDRVVQTGSASVKVALFTQLTPSESTAMSPEQVLRSLEGAYAAQKRANSSRDIGDPTPLIQLYLANAGGRQEHWEPIVDTLVAMSDDSAPLLAVVGLGVSIQATADTADRLSQHRIPMVSAVTSADELNDETFPGLIRVGPSNTDYVKALRGYVEDHDELATAVLVYDENDPDLYVASLTKAFGAQMGEYTHGNPPQPFYGTALDEESSPSLFHVVTQNICQTGADMALYAGRGVDLDALIDALHVRPCLDEPLSVLVAESGLGMHTDQEVLDKLKKSNITVVHASASDPEWHRGGPGVPDGFSGLHEAYEEYVGDPASGLVNGYAVAHHDAVLTAVKAIRLHNRKEGVTAASAEEVRKSLFRLNSQHSVGGAGGTLSFSKTRGGDPGGKVVPVIEIPRADGDEPRLYTTPKE
ncbi:ABC transporter substrate-binding protein [Halostreptopolyspora alba]|uniref:ABC transporter substrate-binding protein n=1 Tax=Halostreptopolyspora alba TaxID=2487137 RepID=UPI0011CDF6C4